MAVYAGRKHELDADVRSVVAIASMCGMFSFDERENEKRKKEEELISDYHTAQLSRRVRFKLDLLANRYPMHLYECAIERSHHKLRSINMYHQTVSQ